MERINVSRNKFLSMRKIKSKGVDPRDFTLSKIGSLRESSRKLYKEGFSITFKIDRLFEKMEKQIVGMYYMK